MKRTQLLLGAALVLLIAACKKSANDPVNKPVEKETELEGKWEMRIVWGNAPVHTFPEGNGFQLNFRKNELLRLEGNEVKKSGRFTIVKDSTVESVIGLKVPDGQFGSRILIEADPKEHIFYQFSNDTLYLLQGFFPTDAGSKRGYVRIP